MIFTISTLLEAAPKSEMLFGISPLFALIPLILYIVLAFKDLNPVLNVFICVIFSAILTKQPLLKMGSVIGDSLGSFLGLIGFIILIGAALGEVLKRTGVAENIVKQVMRKIGINTINKAIIASMCTSMILVALLGTLAGANAIIAPIVIPLVAAIGMTPSTLSGIFLGAGLTGMFIGPFSPQVITIMELTGMSYGVYMLQAGLPLAVTVLAVTFFMSKYIQKKTFGVYAYEEMAEIDVNKPATAEASRATIVFFLVLAAMIAYGIYSQSGASYAIVVMMVTAIATGLAAKMKPSAIFEAITTGAQRLVWLFIMFVLFHPFITFIENAGAFQRLVELIEPLLGSGSQIIFSIVAALTGIFGIGGAAVAQSVVMDKMFAGFVTDLAISPGLWALIILVGSQITSFAYPEADMLGQMGLARSKDVKNVVKLGVTAVVFSILLVGLRAIFG
ncbi:MAG: Na+/H+ antiporter NhaC family protein [Eubacteriales bacterium]|nr:Na+/H+ antiporter NhaC family protein [Eubacteriales bacterium]